MKSLKWLLAGMVAFGLVCTSSVFAGEGKEKGEKAEDRFEKIDTDDNGSISKEEYKAVHERRIAAMKEKMGDKFDATKAPDLDETFARLDADNSGEISREEFTATRTKAKKHLEGAKD